MKMNDKQEQSKKYDEALINWSKLSDSQKDKVLNRVVEKNMKEMIDRNDAESDTF
jgi:predicted Fe-S protein YdhL (DUF1289 family)